MSSDQRALLDELLHAIGQEHLLAAVKNEAETATLVRQLQGLDLPRFFKLQESLKAQPPECTYSKPSLTEPQNHADHPQRFGCLILAGGQASRLRLKGPKGCVPISSKSLFQLHIEKICAASKQMGEEIPVAIMTSPQNCAETEIFFQQHAYFGMKPTLVSFFSQQEWPLLNFDGNLFLSAPGKLAYGANGNGDLYHSFVKSGIWERWEQEGIKHVRVMPVDNPLALPIDPTLCATHVAQQNEVTMQVIAKEPDESAGTLSLINGKLGVLEYGEFTCNEGYANIGLYAFSMPFIKRAAAAELPLHRAKKGVKCFSGEVPKEPNAWKFETFIFDAFSLSEKSAALLYLREHCFAPLKNFEGKGSIDDVRAALLAREQEIFATVTGNRPPSSATFELGAHFYYPTEEELKRWKGKPFPGEQLIEDL